MRIRVMEDTGTPVVSASAIEQVQPQPRPRPQAVPTQPKELILVQGVVQVVGSNSPLLSDRNR